MLWVDIKYANMLSNTLDKFEVKQNNPYGAHCRCPLCGDSKKNPNKSRGGIYTSKNKLWYKCFNCGINKSFSSLLKEVHSDLYDQYKIEIFKEKYGDKSTQKEDAPMEFVPPNFTDKNILDDHFTKVKDLPSNHDCYIYCQERQIPVNHLNRLYYIDDFTPIAKHYKLKMKNRVKNRLGIPFYDKHKNLSGITCRALDNSSLRYYTAKFGPFPLLYGIERVNEKNVIYVVEGPIDSLFLNNAIAIGSSDLTRIEKQYTPNQCVLVYDNQPRNIEIKKLMLNAWNKGFSVVIWPKNIKEKDLNEMVISGINIDKTIKTHTYKDAELFLRISQWSKV